MNRAWLSERPAPSPDRVGAALRGFGPIGLLAIAVILLTGNVIGAALVFGWAWLSRTPLRSLGFRRPRRWAPMLAIGAFVAGAALKLVMKAIVLPLLGFDPINHTYHYLAGNSLALRQMLLITVGGGGFGEETIWRGFLFERLGTLFRGQPAAKIATLVVTAVLFGAAHYADQGLAGATQAVITGLVFGGIFAVSSLIWWSMMAHAAYDVVAVLMIYWNLESDVAHWLFR